MCLFDRDMTSQKEKVIICKGQIHTHLEINLTSKMSKLSTLKSSGNRLRLNMKTLLMFLDNTIRLTRNITIIRVTLTRNIKVSRGR